MALVMGCAALEPVDVDQDTSDQSLSAVTLKREVRTQQRIIEDLRDELKSYKKELADARIAQARMEGQVREVERRFAEARQIVTLQREELARIRGEREKVLSSGQELQRHMKALQRQLAKLSSSPRRNVAQTSVPSKKKPVPSKVVAPPLKKNEAPPVSSAVSTTKRKGLSLSTGLKDEDQDTQGFVAVQAGDTLWSLARRYGVNLLELRALNELTSDQIFPGQALLLPLLLGASGK